MGSKPSKRSKPITKAENVQKIEKTKANLERITQQTQNPGPQNPEQLIVNNQTRATIATSIAVRQLNRGGSSLTKDDLIAILMFLKMTTTKTNVYANEFQNVTREILVAEIRSIIYDPEQIFSVLFTVMHETQPSAPESTVNLPSAPEFAALT